MVDLALTLGMVEVYLKSLGFDAETDGRPKDGNCILRACAQMRVDECPNCVVPALKNMFTLLEQGKFIDFTPTHEWSRASTLEALKAGNIPADGIVSD